MTTWKFWGTTPKKPEPPAWPTDAYQSVRYLVGFYAMQDSMPFHEWKSPLVTVSPAIEDTVKNAVRRFKPDFIFGSLSPVSAFMKLR